VRRIIRGGENVFPREVEDYLYTFPHLMDVSAYGVTDETMGEEIAANIILKAGSPPVTAEDIKAFCKGKIAHYKIPKHVRFVTSVPQTGSGKIQKVRFRSLHC
jgi:fatty-acyl-CoA synthase